MRPVDASSLMQMRAAILQQNSALQKANAPSPVGGVGGIGGVGGAAEAKPGGFTAALGDALSKVNDAQSKATAASNSYERGETTDVASVMLAREQASVGFQATLQVRNKLLSAYKDIMSMPV